MSKFVVGEEAEAKRKSTPKEKALNQMERLLGEEMSSELYRGLQALSFAQLLELLNLLRDALPG